MPIGTRTSASIRGCLMAAALLGAVACDRAPEAPPAPPTELEPAAADLLRKVSQDLGALSTFQFETSTTRERVHYNGEKETQSFVQRVVVRRPNAFSLHRDLDGVAQVALYDGENVTFRNDNEKVWGRVGAPDNLNDTLEFLADALRVPVSMGDLFLSDPYSAFVGEQTLGRVVGTEDIGGRSCRHATFVDPVLDFEIWVPVEGPAYPCRLRMVYKTARRLTPDGGRLQRLAGQPRAPGRPVCRCDPRRVPADPCCIRASARAGGVDRGWQRAPRQTPRTHRTAGLSTLEKA